MPPARVLFVGLTCGALVYVGRGFFVGPPSAWVAALAVSAYLGAMLVGVLVLRLGMFVDVVVAGPAQANGVALTFDDGPDPATTPRVLDALDGAQAKGTFFLIGKKAERHPEIVRAIVARGHAVGLHSYAHDRFFALRGPAEWRRDLQKGIRALEAITGERPRLFRPPIGHTNPHVGGVLRELGLVVIGWTVSARDGIRGEPRAIAKRVLDRAKNGAIVLMHDASERGYHTPAGVDALPSILAGLAKRKLAVANLADWIP